MGLCWPIWATRLRMLSSSEWPLFADSNATTVYQGALHRYLLENGTVMGTETLSTLEPHKINMSRRLVVCPAVDVMISAC